MTSAIALIALSATAGLLLMPMVLRYARRRGMLDVPNARSSHSRVTPRGGGAAIVIVVLVMLAGLAARNPDLHRVAIALAGGGVLVAGVGWIDDLRQVSALPRIVVHTVAAVWIVAWIGGMPILALGGATVRLGWVGAVVACILIAWFINLYNFMDGIDGIAGTQAVLAALALGSLLTAEGDTVLASVCWVLAGAAGAFLVWNWPPAKIFMGDVGSGFIGMCLGTMAVAAQNRSALELTVPLVLLGVFIVDATATLLRRLLSGERWFDAHRSHAYQRAVQHGFTHRQVTVAVIVVNLGLWVAAWTMRTSPRMSVPVALGTMAALIGLWAWCIRHLHAGPSEAESNPQ